MIIPGHIELAAAFILDVASGISASMKSRIAYLFLGVAAFLMIMGALR